MTDMICPGKSWASQTSERVGGESSGHCLSSPHNPPPPHTLPTCLLPELVQRLALPHTNCVTLGMYPNFSVPQFLIYEMGIKYLLGLGKTR